MNYFKEEIKSKEELIKELKVYRAQLAVLEEERAARKRAEEEILEKAKIIDQIHDAVVSTDLNGNIISWNHGAERIYGYSKKEAIGKPVSFLYREEERETLPNKVINKLKESGDYDLELWCLKNSGEEVFVHLSLSVLKDANGDPKGLIGYSLDITERKKIEEDLKVLNEELEQKVKRRTNKLALANKELENEVNERREIEKKLREEEIKYRSLIEQIPAITFLAKPEINTGMIYVSPQIKELLGFSEEQWINDPTFWTKTLHPDDRERAVTNYVNNVSNKNLFIDEYRMIDSKGSIHWMQERVKVLRDEFDNPLFIQGLLLDITDLKSAEVAESYLSAIVEYSPDGIIGTDLDGTIFSWNPGAEKIYGYSRKEVIGNSVSKIFPPENYKEILETINKIKNGESIEQYETLRIRKDGKRIYVLVDISPIKNTDGTITGISAVVRDVTKRRQAEQELNETQRKFSTLIGNLPGFAYRCKNDKDWTMEYLTDGFFELTGYKPEEIINSKTTTFNSLIIPEDQKYVWDTVQEAITKRQPYVLEYRIKTKAGKEKWIWEKGQGVFSKDKELIALEGFDLDITERRKYEAKLQQLAAIVESSQDAVMSKSIDGTIISWNSGAEKIYGYSKDEVIGKNFLTFIPDKYRNETENIFNKIKQGENIEQFETVRQKKDGTEIYVSLTVSPVKDTTGNITGISAIARDITIRRKLQKELEKIKQKEQQEKEIRSLEKLASSPGKSDVTIQLFGLIPLRESFPAIFNNLVKQYEHILERAISDKDEKLKQLLSNELSTLGKEIAKLNGGPSDVMEIHNKVLKNKGSHSSLEESESYSEKARFLLLELLGNLISYYRKHSLIAKESPAARNIIKI